MVVAKRQRREKPAKIKQRKVKRRSRGPEPGPQAEQAALLASSIYIGQAQWEGKKHIKRGAKGLELSLVFTSLGPHSRIPQGCIFLLFSK